MQARAQGMVSTLLVVAKGSLGDVLPLLCALRAILPKLNQPIVHVITHVDHADLFARLPVPTHVHLLSTLPMDPNETASLDMECVEVATLSLEVMRKTGNDKSIAFLGNLFALEVAILSTLMAASSLIFVHPTYPYVPRPGCRIGENASPSWAWPLLTDHFDSVWKVIDEQWLATPLCRLDDALRFAEVVVAASPFWVQISVPPESLRESGIRIVGYVGIGYNALLDCSGDSCRAEAFVESVRNDDPLYLPVVLVDMGSVTALLGQSSDELHSMLALVDGLVSTDSCRVLVACHDGQALHEGLEMIRCVSRLPPNRLMVCARHIDHHLLFPKVAVVVHHGGVGTTQAALFSGCNQVIVPMLYDQIHNGICMEQLGVGKCWRNADNTPEPQRTDRLKALVMETLHPMMRLRALTLAKKLRDDPAERFGQGLDEFVLTAMLHTH